MAAVTQRVDETGAGDAAPPEEFDDGQNSDGGDDGAEGFGSGDGPWVTVATFWQAPSAHIARLRLESAGIDCAILDENLVATDWLYANAVGGIKLQVPTTDADRAVELLSGKHGDPGPTNPERQPLFDGQDRCPACGSREVYPVRLSRRLIFLSILLLGAPLPIFTRRTRCATCAFEWR